MGHPQNLKLQYLKNYNREFSGAISEIPLFRVIDKLLLNQELLGVADKTMSV